MFGNMMKTGTAFMTASVTDTSASRSSNEAAGPTTCGTDAAGAASRAMDGE
ncbi:MAG: hypothetical protein GX279_00680 [Clostridiaceae bacterium]|nr:hypothetical protein [Clostridiaceae bacterium]